MKLNSITTLSALLLASMTSLSPSAPLFAQSVDILEMGGYHSGGEPFRRECPAGQYMTGLEGRRGAWVDSIAPRCAAWDGATQTFGPAQRLELAGGTGGGPAIAYCNNAPFVVSMSASVTASYVDELSFSCRDKGGTFREKAVFNEDEDLGRPLFAPFGVAQQFTQCPVNHAAVGLHGRAGDYLDAIGLICGPLPADEVPRPDITGVGGASMTRRAGGPDLGVGGASPQMQSRLPAPAQAPVPPASSEVLPQRHDAPSIRSDDGVMERLDYCLNFGEDCGTPAAAAYCASVDPQRPVSMDAPLEFGIGRSFTIGDRQLCQQDNCSSFTHIVCAPRR